MSVTRKVLLYTGLAYGWSWFFWLPTALADSGRSVPAAWANLGEAGFALGGWGPLVAAFVVMGLTEGPEGLRALARRAIKFRFGGRWYAAALLLFPLLIGGSLLLDVLSGAPLPKLPAVAEPFTLPIAFVVVLFTSGPFTEEFGWRGLVQTQLQQRWSALAASVVVGLLWGAWHLPLFFVETMELYYDRPIWGLMLSTVLVSILITCVYNGTGESLAAAMLMHAAFNWSHWVFPALQSDRASLILFGLQAAAVVMVVRRYGARTLARGRA